MTTTWQQLVALTTLLLCAAGVCWAQAPAVPAKRARIAYIGHSPDAERWWDPVKNGLADARADIDIDFLNPADGRIEEMARIVAGLSLDKYDGVASTIADFRELAMRPGEGRHLNSGPGFISRINVDKVQLYGGQYR